ncbi:sugar-binding domain-containing protein [Solibacillus sp. CAU 1738]|uniref:sugar-binding transcriptional regulator n=1 Tax=Solibacillus sp. CAU 1738 TaxID=3140363 RepID=UPI0032609FC8
MDKKTFFEAQRKLLPEMDTLLKKRYRMLQIIYLQGPIGRRTLAEALQLTERDIRNEMQILNEQQLIDIHSKGMVCTEIGEAALEQLKELFHELTGIAKKEQKLKEAFNIDHVIIVHGNVETDSTTYAMLGKEANSVLVDYAKPNSQIAITGGSSVAAMGPYLQPQKPLNTAQFIAARGGIGDEMTMQANTLVAQFAAKSNSKYRTLFLPEQLSEQAYSAMKEEPIVKEMMALYDEVNIVIHGIGAAEEMAERRNSSEKDKALLLKKGAVGEAFGYYFDEQGQIVHHIRTVGIQLEQVKKSDVVIAIAGGIHKAKAIQAYFKNAAKQTVFITDESAANEILKHI